MYSFFGVLISAGANNSNTDHVNKMWKKNAYPLYRATMGRIRFQSLLRFIRFDDYTTRPARVANDKAALISDTWKMLNANLAALYRPTEHLTIDEQLYPFRGRTKFTQYMPSKPAKYGLQVFWLCDASNAYPLKGILYTGKQGNTREVNQAERVVKDLVSDYKGSCRNITTDRFFTTLPLVETLLSWKLTIVGTLKKK
ncbi:uncharacterized protein LOC120781528 [Bactrocera tryoni]|uniref:uncharacterized protein LOC120781528 n=1 Tax=Bactrocera tryoni TaxID=59916 RepID=UPI001A96D230|nr:uncharacterized protein LOC120781528 [Bactrocera tryoni]